MILSRRPDYSKTSRFRCGDRRFDSDPSASGSSKRPTAGAARCMFVAVSLLGRRQNPHTAAAHHWRPASIASHRRTCEAEAAAADLPPLCRCGRTTCCVATPTPLANRAAQGACERSNRRPGNARHFTQTETADRRLVPGNRPGEAFIDRRQQVVVRVEHAVCIGALQEAVRNERGAAALQATAENQRARSRRSHGRSIRRTSCHLGMFGRTETEMLDESAEPTQTDYSA